MKFEPRPYQQYAIQRIIDSPAVCLMLDMGMGKTVTTLTAVQSLLSKNDVSKVLVIAPLHVAETTWIEEPVKWEHLNISVTPVLGTLAKRIAALNSDADLFVINRENVCWLIEYFNYKLPFDMLVIDESSSFKNPSAKRFKFLKKIKFKRVVTLTGTPAPNSLMDLWAQIYLLDRGQRLGRTIGDFRKKYFNPGAFNDHIIYNWTLKRGADKLIFSKIADICVSMKSSDYLTLPPVIYNSVKVKLDARAQSDYDEFQRSLIIDVKGKNLVASSAAVLANKLLQFANGAVYDDDSNVTEIHSKKLDALGSLLDSSNIIVFYQFRHDLSRLKAKFPFAVELNSADDIADWNAGKISMLLAHPASAGHGLNLQFGGNIIVWFGLTWSLELYQQANKRLHRPGQTKPVVIHHLIAEGTIDEMVLKVLSKKDSCQNDLLLALKGALFYG